jgi:hypothetical protein
MAIKVNIIVLGVLIMFIVLLSTIIFYQRDIILNSPDGVYVSFTHYRDNFS